RATAPLGGSLGSTGQVALELVARPDSSRASIEKVTEPGAPDSGTTIVVGVVLLAFIDSLKYPWTTGDDVRLLLRVTCARPSGSEAAQSTRNDEPSKTLVAGAGTVVSDAVGRSPRSNA